MTRQATRIIRYLMGHEQMTIEELRVKLKMPEGTLPPRASGPLPRPLRLPIRGPPSPLQRHEASLFIEVIMRVEVTINGGPDNPWHVYGLTANPFPKIGRAEFGTANRMLRELDSDPITSQDQIRIILKGCDQEFIDRCVERYRPGERVSFIISWPS